MAALLGYARVSTADQDLDAQRRRLDAAGVARIFEDTASGKAAVRVGLAALLDYARAGDTVVVVRLDRLARSLRDLIDIVEALRQKGVGLKSLEEAIDTTSAAGELTLHIFGALAQFERRLIISRTHDGLAVARANGKAIGRPKRDKAKLEAAALLVEVQGMSPVDAAAAVGVGRSTLYEELRARRDLAALAAEAEAAAEPPPKPPRKRRGKVAAQSVNA